MNTRCYRCGWSFSMNREALEEAAVSSAGQKAHVIHCPRCRQTIRVPMDQILKALPAGWTPNPAAENQAAEPAASEPETAAKADLTPEAEAATATERSPRRHRHSSKTHSGDSAAEPAAKKSTHTN